MYEIVQRKNYQNQFIHVLLKDKCNMGVISQKNMDLFNARNIEHNDSDGIEKYLKYNNL